MYIVLFLVGGMVISSTEDIPLMTALFETASAIDGRVIAGNNS